MKNLVLFEAFKTDKLNKTLGFMENPQEKEKFRSDLKKLSQFYDFPISEFNDDMFHYLGYQKALKLINYPVADKCDYSYPSHEDRAIHGESCQNGKIKRRWGAGERNVECPGCNGSGEKKPMRKNKYLKFWFNKDGRYTGTTVTNSLQSSVDSSFSKNLEDYEIVKEFTSAAQMKRECENGDTLMLNLYSSLPSTWRPGYSRPTGDIVVTVYKRGTQIYGIQDDVYSNVDTWYFRDFPWRSFGSRVTNISSPSSFVGRAKLIKRSNASTDPLYWNHGVDLSNMRTSSNVAKSEILNDANFALVLDLDKIDKTETEYVDVSTTRNKRDTSRKDALALKSDVDIKNENIQRYLSKIAENTNVDIKDLKNFNMTFKRMLGFNNFMWQRIIAQSRTTEAIEQITSEIYQAMNGDSTVLTNYTIPRIKSKYNDSIGYARTGMLLKRDLLAYSENEQEKANAIIICDIIDKWGQEINKKMSTLKCDTISDLIAFSFKAKTSGISKFPNLSNLVNKLRRGSSWGRHYLGECVRMDIEGIQSDFQLQIEYIKSL